MISNVCDFEGGKSKKVEGGGVTGRMILNINSLYML